MSSDPPTCPLCGSAGPARTFRFGGPPWTLWACPDCSTIFVAPSPDPTGLARYYEYRSYGAPGYTRPSWRNRQAVSRMTDLLADLEASGARPGSLLDVGCSVGSFLIAGRGRGWEASGIEIDPETARLAEQRSGCRVRAGVGLEALEARDRFDLITMNHWLEHTPDPGHQARLARQHLSPGGRLLIRVPNAQGHAARWLGEWWNWYQPPVHLEYFAPRSFHALATLLGLTVDRLEGRQGDASHLLVELLTGRGRELVAGIRRTGTVRPDADPRSPRLSPAGRQLLRTAVEVVSSLAEMVLPVSRWDDSEILCVLRDPSPVESRARTLTASIEG